VLHARARGGWRRLFVSERSRRVYADSTPCPERNRACCCQDQPAGRGSVAAASAACATANIAIAIAVYEESHNLFSSKFDAARKGVYKFTAEEQRGLMLFNGKAKCSKCHPSSGQAPLFTDYTYDNLGVPKNPASVNSSWADPGLGGSLATHELWSYLAAGEMGKMKVPTLRNVDMRPHPHDVKAYMHNGVFKSLEEVVRRSSAAWA
jgi:cytochrome c peroxidase